jgi:hypothetical protein
MSPSSIQEMTNEQLTGLAAPWPGATTDVEWGADLVLSVGGTMLCTRAAAPDAPLSFKVDGERFLEPTDRPAFAPAPHRARAGRVQATPRPGRRHRARDAGPGERRARSCPASKEGAA